MADPDSFVPDVTRAAQRDYGPVIERAKLEWLTGAFRSAFGRSPRSHRAGRFGIGPHTLPTLEALGYTVDSSVTPHVEWHEVSRGLSFVGAPEQPYHPDSASVRRPGSSAVVEVPITIRPGLLSRLPLVGRRMGHRWLRPTRSAAAALIAIARHSVAEAVRHGPRTPVVLNMMLHNVEVVPGASPYASTSEQALRIVERISAFLSWAEREGIHCIGLGDVPALMDASS
jgi:hypothetical protein